MTMEIENYLKEFIKSVPEICGIVYHDKEGVLILQAFNEKFTENILTPDFLNIFNLTCQQISKIGIGETKKLISIYNKYQIIQFYKEPIVLTVIATCSGNTGYISNIDKDLYPITTAIQTFLK